MSLEMSMRMTTKQITAQTMRLSVEQTLEARAQQVQSQSMGMELYLKREDDLVHLYWEAAARGDVRSYTRHGLHFNYARVRREEVPRAAKAYGCAFAHCLYNPFELLLGGTKYARSRGDWLLFVIVDYFASLPFPEQFVELAAVHEHGEEITLGNHVLATKLEHVVAKEERLLHAYLDWQLRHYRERITSLFSTTSQTVLPDDDELQHALALRRGSGYVRMVLEKIGSFRWPRTALEKIRRFHCTNEAAKARLRRGLRTAADVARTLDASLSIPQAVAYLGAVLDPYLQHIREQADYVCRAELEEIYRQGWREIASAFDAYRHRRQRILCATPAGERQYLREVGEAIPNNNLPRWRIF